MTTLPDGWVEEYVGQCEPVEGSYILDFVRDMNEQGYQIFHPALPYEMLEAALTEPVPPGDTYPIDGCPIPNRRFRGFVTEFLSSSDQETIGFLCDVVRRYRNSAATT